MELWRNYGGKHCRVIEGNQVVNVARKLAFLKPLYSLFHAMTLVRHTPSPSREGNCWWLILVGKQRKDYSWGKDSLDQTISFKME